MTGDRTAIDAPHRAVDEDAADRIAEQDRARYRRGVAELLERRATRPAVLRDILAPPLDMASVYSIGDILQHLRPLTGQPLPSDVFGLEPRLLVRGLHIIPSAQPGLFRFVQDAAGPHQYDVLAAALALLPGFDDIEVHETEIVVSADATGLRLIAAIGEAPAPISPALVAPEQRLAEYLVTDAWPYGAARLDTDTLTDLDINHAALDAVGSVRGRPIVLAVTGPAADRTVARLHRVLTATGLRDRALLLCASEHLCGIDVVVSAALGADRMTASEAPRGPLLTDVRGHLARVGITDLAHARGRVDLLHAQGHSAFSRDTHAGDRVTV
ncbi:glutamate synthase-related protein [Millisia brevis]|uniref:glutamate synthase-related protein n=1 Tax=Millisia brevis TaxID=264148 RepID=UPI00082CB906|nr:glutamate synthase-related protein [Millisia brevis]